MPGWLAAVRAAESKKGQEIKVIDLREVTSFCDYFVICTGSSSRQNQSIADEVCLQLKRQGEMAISMEGYDGGEWVLVDFGDFLVHIFLDKTRTYYDLERLWRHAKNVEIPPESAAV